MGIGFNAKDRIQEANPLVVKQLQEVAKL
jgi:hypothetical protein